MSFSRGVGVDISVDRGTGGRKNRGINATNTARSDSRSVQSKAHVASNTRHHKSDDVLCDGAGSAGDADTLRRNAAIRSDFGNASLPPPARRAGGGYRRTGDDNRPNSSTPSYGAKCARMNWSTLALCTLLRWTNRSTRAKPN